MGFLSSGILTIDYSATGAIVENVVVFNDGTNITLSGDVSGTTSFATASVNRLEIQDSGGSSNQSLTVAGTSTLNLISGLLCRDISTVTVNNSIVVSGASTVDINVHRNIEINAGLSSVSGQIKLFANQQATTTPGSFTGCALSNATIQSSSGSVLIQGRGTSGLDFNGGSIQSSSNSVTLQGTGTAGLSILIRNNCIVNAGGGDLTVTGTGTAGIALMAGSVLSTSGTGKVVVSGTGDTAGVFGVTVTDANTKVMSTAGNISITGKGGLEGVSVAKGGMILAGGSGTVNVTGTALGANSRGVTVSNTNSRISSAGGAVSITGTGGGIGGDSTNNGVVVSAGGEIYSSAGGNVSVTGLGGNSSGSGNANHGVLVTGTNSRISTVDGTINVNGTGGGSSSSSGPNYGVYVVGSGEIYSMGSGSVSVTGKGGGVGGNGSFNFGVFVSQIGSRIASSNGPVSVSGFGTKTSEAIRLQFGGLISSGAMNNVEIAADSLNIADVDSIIRAGASADKTVVIRPQSSTTQIHLNGVDQLATTPLVLGLNEAELNHLLAGTIQVGNSMTNSILLNNDLNLTSSVNLELIAGGVINLAANLKTVADIALTATGPIMSAGVIQTAGKLSFNSPGQVTTITSNGNKAAQVIVASGTTAKITGSIDSSTPVRIEGSVNGPGTVGPIEVVNAGKLVLGTDKLSTGNVKFNSGSVFTVQLNGTMPGTDHGQLFVNGTVDLENASLQGSLTFAPAIGNSLLILDNDAADAIVGTFAALAEGGSLTIDGREFTISYKGGDGNDVVITPQLGQPPTLVAIDVNNGASQRSLVTSIKVSFSQIVNVSPGAFQVERIGKGSAGIVGTDFSQFGSYATITFKTGGAIGVNPGNSLQDGQYKITVFADKVTGGGGSGTLDGNGNGISDGNPVDNKTATFHRLFGDGNGDGVVNTPDFALFRSFFGGGSSMFDYNNNASTDSPDFAQFRSRFGLTGYLP